MTALQPSTRRTGRQKPPLPSADVRNTHSLTSLLQEQRDVAAAVVVTDEQLAEWYAQQLAWTRERMAELAGRVTRNLARLTTKDDPNWLRFWQQEALFRYMDDTLALLERAGHILVCAKHGAVGQTEPFLESDWQGLAWRGRLDNNGTWELPCADCAPVRLAGETLMRAWVLAGFPLSAKELAELRAYRSLLTEGDGE